MNFIQAATTGFFIVLQWMDQVIQDLPLFQYLAIPIAISAVLIAIKLIKSFIWGS